MEALEGEKRFWTTVSCFQSVLMQVRLHAMMTYWEGFGCSEVMEVDLNDSFTFLSRFRLLCCDEFGNS